MSARIQALLMFAAAVSILAACSAPATKSLRRGENLTSMDQQAGDSRGDDSQNDQQSVGTSPNPLTGTNLVTLGNALPDCEDHLAGKALTGFSCYTAIKTAGKPIRSKYLEDRLTVRWELPPAVSGNSNCPQSMNGATEIHCNFVSPPTAPFRIKLKVSKDSQLRELPSDPIASSSSTGSGGSGGDISVATSLVVYIAGPVRGDAGIDGFNAVCKTPLDNPSPIGAQLQISNSAVLLNGWESLYSLPLNPGIWTPEIDSVSGLLVRGVVSLSLSSFTNPLYNGISQNIYRSLDGQSHSGDPVWTGMGQEYGHGAACNNWSDDQKAATYGIIGHVDQRRLFAGEESCSRSYYVYCLGW